MATNYQALTNADLSRVYRSFFRALGWDIIYERGLDRASQEVIHEDAIKVGNATKALCKPYDTPEPALQLRR